MAQLDWLEGAQAALNASPAFRKLGTADVVIGLKSGRVVRRVTFEAFEVSHVEAVEATVLRDCDITIEMSPRDWTNYLRRRAKGSGPTLQSLNLDRKIVQAANPLNQLKFDRYHLSLQALVDEGARLVR